MNTIEKLGDEETFKNIVERTITEFEDNEIEVIGSYAFYNCGALTSISLPVATSIGVSAFRDCSALTSVSLPAVTKIEGRAFGSCSALTSVSLPVATKIESEAFYGCSNLEAINLESLESIGDLAFSSCNSIKTLHLPKLKTLLSNTSEKGEFSYCRSLTEVNFPILEVTSYGTFKSCTSLNKVSLPNLKTVKSSTFYNCSGLTEVSFPNVTYIDSWAFRYCSGLTEVTFPRVTTIISEAFVGCSKLTTMYIGTESDTVCTLSNTDAIPSNVTDIYVPSELVDSYKTATNWSSFADKIKSYEVPVSCQSLTITAEDVPWYKTSTTVHYEAVCTYSIEGMMQTGTKVFKGDAASDTFSANSSEESSRQVEVSYTFLGQTATTTITQDKHRTDLVGGTIFYIDSSADGEYEFYDINGELISNVAVGDKPYSYKVVTPGSKDKYYTLHDELYDSLKWTYYKDGSYVYTNIRTGTAIGTGKSNTATVLAADDGAYVTANSNGYPTIWYKLQQTRDAFTGGNNDWFIPSRYEVDEVRKAGFMESGFKNKNIWSSSEDSAQFSWRWASNRHDWNNYYKDGTYSVFFARAF